MKFSLETGGSRKAIEAPRGGELLKSAMVMPGHAKWLRKVGGPRMTRMYDAAVTDQYSQDFPISITSANAEILVSALAARSRAQRLERDEPYAFGLINAHINNVGGHDPFRLEMKVGKWSTHKNGKQFFEEEVETNRLIETAWKKAGRPENCTVYRDLSRSEMYWQAIASLIRDGGYLIRKWSGYSNRYGFAIEPMDIARLDHNWNRPNAGSGNEIQMGMERDAMHGILAYHILTRHPGDVFAWSNSPRYRERVPAEDVICLWDIRTRGGQYAGMPRFSSIIKRLHFMRQYDRAEMVAAIWASCKPWFLTQTWPAGKEQPYQPDEESLEGEKVSDVKPGEGEILPFGVKPELVDPKHPTEAYSHFIQQNLRAVACGGGVAYHTLSNDLSGFNFASGRIGVIAERDEYKKLQEHVKMNLVQPHFEEWLRHAILSGELKLPIGRLEEFQDAAVFHARRWAYIDPIKDVQRDILSIEAGLDSRQHVISESERGGDTELIDGEQASDMAIDEAHELDFAGSDPTKPTLKPGAPGEEVPNPEGATAPRTGGKQTLKKGRKVNWERAGRALHLERNGEH